MDPPSTLHLDPVNPKVKGGGNLYVAVKLKVRVKVKVKVRDPAPPARNERVLVGSPSGPHPALRSRDRRGA